MAMGGLNRTGPPAALEEQFHFEAMDLSTRSQWVVESIFFALLSAC